MNTKIIIAIVIVLLLIGGALLLSGSHTATIPAGDSASQTAPPPGDNAVSEPAPLPPSVTPPASGNQSIKEFVVTGQNYSFTPATLTVKKGDLVRITFKNSGGMHDFRIDALNVATRRIGSGEEDAVEFTADTAGSFEYYCSVGNHRAMGMKGMLTVEP